MSSRGNNTKQPAFPVRDRNFPERGRSAGIESAAIAPSDRNSPPSSPVRDRNLPERGRSAGIESAAIAPSDRNSPPSFPARDIVLPSPSDSFSIDSQAVAFRPQSLPDSGSRKLAATSIPATIHHNNSLVVVPGVGIDSAVSAAAGVDRYSPNQVELVFRVYPGDPKPVSVNFVSSSCIDAQLLKEVGNYFIIQGHYDKVALPSTPAKSDTPNLDSPKPYLCKLVFGYDVSALPSEPNRTSRIKLFSSGTINPHELCAFGNYMIRSNYYDAPLIPLPKLADHLSPTGSGVTQEQTFSATTSTDSQPKRPQPRRSPYREPEAIPKYDKPITTTGNLPEPGGPHKQPSPEQHAARSSAPNNADRKKSPPSSFLSRRNEAEKRSVGFLLANESRPVSSISSIPDETAQPTASQDPSKTEELRQKLNDIYNGNSQIPPPPPGGNFLAYTKKFTFQ